MSDAWEVFVASIDRTALETERMRAPKESERPGSAADRMMRTSHELMKARVKARRVRVAAEVLAVMLAESAEFDSGSAMVMPRLAAWNRKAS
jgi:hypothetical protein